MGMFDWVKCEYPLPDGWSSDQFQTKDLENALLNYVVTADGRLKLVEHDYEDDGPPREHVLLGQFIGMYQPTRVVGTRLVDLDHHGYLRFYADEKTADPKKRIWHEYTAKFTDGNIVEIKVEIT